MGLIGPATLIKHRPHRVALFNPGNRVPDPDGGYDYEWNPCTPPEMFARIQAATSNELDRVAAGTVVTTATHIITIPFHPQVTTNTRVIFQGRTFHVIGPPTNPDERNIELELVCAELVSSGPAPAEFIEPVPLEARR